MDHSSTSKKTNIQKEQQKMAGEVSLEERVRAVEVWEGSSVMCGFCSKPRLPAPMEGGKMFSLQGVTVHYFCFLFSYNSLQLGEDTEGRFGFFGGEKNS